MSDYYRNQPPITLFNNVTLTANATDNRRTFAVGGFQKISLDFRYTMGATETLNKIHFTLEHSPDNGANWHTLVIDSTSGSVSALTPRVWEWTGTGNFNVIVDIAYKDMRLSIYESGVATNAGTATVFVTPSGL